MQQQSKDAGHRRLASAMTLVGACLASPHAQADVDPAWAVRIELRPDVQVRQTAVTLGEVANLTSRDLSTLRRLMALPLGHVPRSGEPVSLDRETLFRWLRVRGGMEPTQVEWLGGAASSVRLATHVLTGEQIAASAEAHLQAMLKASGLRGEIVVTAPPRDVDIPVGKAELRARPLASLQPSVQGSPWPVTGVADAPAMPKRQSLWLDLWVDGRFVRTVVVGFELSVFAPALVALGDLASGQVVDPARPEASRLVVREVEWTGRSSPPLKPASSEERGNSDAASGSAQGESPAKSAALKLRRQVPAGQALTRADVEAVPLVARGDYATLHSAQGPIAVESRVEVLQDGVAGQSVRVKLPSASTAIVARVVGPGAVEVRE
jgi:flagella basal body P-ring formation protein FlgA